MMETWKKIEGYEDIYEISNFGRFRSVDHLTLKVGSTFNLYPYLGRDLHPSSTKSGGLRITLRNGPLKHTFSVSRLVAKHFLVGYTEECKIVFLDGNKKNCRADNLRIISNGD